MYLTWTVITLVLYQVMAEMSLGGDILSRSRRQLLFPNVTLLQLNAGVGTPTPIKTIFVNWAFQANFVLPVNRTQIPVDIFGANSGYDGESRKKRDVTDFREHEYENDAKLYHFYKYVEEVVNGYGDNGTACVLQALCQVGAEPLQSDDDENLLHEIATFVLNPKNDMSHGLPNIPDSLPYITAYDKGHGGDDCHGAFGPCSTLLVDMFTIIQGTP